MREKDRKLRICHVFAGTEGGRWVYEQLEALKKDHGCEVHAVLGGDQGTTVDLCRAAGIPVKAFDFQTSWRSLLSIPWRIIRLAFWMRRQGFDVVQSHVIQSTLFARPAAWLADIPVRLEMVTGPFYMQARSTRWVETATVFMETGVVPSCEFTGLLYRRAGVPERLILPTLYYGPRGESWDPARIEAADLRSELRLPEGTPLIGMVAIFYSRCGANTFTPPEAHNKQIKGHGDLIRAMPAVVEAFPDAKLVLVGKGWGPRGVEAEEELRQIVREEALEEVVIFAGYRRDVAAVYLALDISVQASLNDNLGGTIESLLMARPTVATRVGGLVDSVVDGETGITVNPGDPSDLARAIVHLLRHPDEARRLGVNGRARMLDRFTLETTARELVALYRKQLDGATSPHRLGRGVARLAIAAVIAVPIAGRMLWDIVVLNRFPAWYRRVRNAALGVRSKPEAAAPLEEKRA